MQKNNSIVFNVQELINKNKKLSEQNFIEVPQSKDYNEENNQVENEQSQLVEVKQNDSQENSILENVPIASKDILEDCALIQCFWGTDIDRIISVTRALQKTLSQKIGFKKWVFIEAQTEKSLASFGWLKKFGIKYAFKKIDKESENLFLKMPLWNIGASLCDCQKMLFIDSDIYFENPNWAQNSSQKLDQFDVISLAGYSRNENSEDRIESIGHKIMNSSLDDGKFTYGHAGYTLGMTKKAYDLYGKFDAVNYLDDQWFWFKLIGKQQNFDKIFLLPYCPSEEVGYYGYPVKIGSTEETCIHVNHSPENNIKKYKKAHDFSYEHVDFPMQEIEYDKETLGLPRWKDNSIGRVLKNCFARIDEDLDWNDIYIEEAKKEFGEINEQNPLIIMTIYRKDYLHQDSNIVIKHKEMLEQYCKVPFTYVCMSNEKIDDIYTIPYELMINEKLTNNNILKILTDKKILYPKNSNVLYMDINYKIDKNFTITQCKNKIDTTNKYSNILNSIFLKK